VLKAAEGDGLLSVVCNLTENFKGWAVAKVTIENGKFIHEAVHTCFTLQGAMKEHCILLGLPFEEFEGSIDDYS
jgi:hypothetical protein